MQIEIYL